MSFSTTKARRLWQFLKPYWRHELVTLIVMLAITLLILAVPLTVRYLVDVLIPELIRSGAAGAIDLSPVVWFGLALVAIYLLQVVLTGVRDYFVGFIGARIIADMRSHLFAHLERLSLRFFQTHKVGEVMSRFLADVSRIQDLLSSTLLVILNNFLLLFGVLAYLLYDNWQLTLIAIIPVPVTILVTGILSKHIHSTARGLQATVATLSAAIQELLVGLKIVKAFGREDAENKRVDGIMSGLTGFYVKFSVLRSVAGNGIQFVNALGPIIVLCAGAYLVAVGTMQLGQLFAFYMYLSLLYSPVQSLAGSRIEVAAAMASVERIFEYLDLPPAVEEDPAPVRIGKIRGDIKLTEMSFSYGDSNFRIENLNLHIPAGETLALVGPSGSGKTTIINLIMRFYDPDSGIVAVDGVDLRRLSLQTLRDNIALVDQDPLLFNMTIGENIAYSDPAATSEQVQRAARIANIHDFISGLPHGYDSMVGERGVTLSGGEKQRICLARALLKDPPILILDEATSALDSISEQLIQDALDKVLVGKTAIIIAHRLATVQRADRIIALDGGRIVAQGTHSELLGSSALYQELSHKQLRA